MLTFVYVSPEKGPLQQAAGSRSKLSWRLSWVSSRVVGNLFSMINVDMAVTVEQCLDHGQAVPPTQADCLI